MEEKSVFTKIRNALYLSNTLADLNLAIIFALYAFNLFSVQLLFLDLWSPIVSPCTSTV